MLHRAVLGSIERFIAILLEHCAGAFPFWLAPVQVKILTVTDDQKQYAQKFLSSFGMTTGGLSLTIETKNSATKFAKRNWRRSRTRS